MVSKLAILVIVVVVIAALVYLFYFDSNRAMSEISQIKAKYGLSATENELNSVSEIENLQRELNAYSQRLDSVSFEGKDFVKRVLKEDNYLFEARKNELKAGDVLGNDRIYACEKTEVDQGKFYLNQELSNLKNALSDAKDLETVNAQLQFASSQIVEGKISQAQKKLSFIGNIC